MTKVMIIVVHILALAAVWAEGTCDYFTGSTIAGASTNESGDSTCEIPFKDEMMIALGVGITLLVLTLLYYITGTIVIFILSCRPYCFRQEKQELLTKSPPAALTSNVNAV